jgi:DNA mismatch repair ATPase MutL
VGNNRTARPPQVIANEVKTIMGWVSNPPDSIHREHARKLCTFINKRASVKTLSAEAETEFAFIIKGLGWNTKPEHYMILVEFVTKEGYHTYLRTALYPKEASSRALKKGKK